ncbi:F0F1 ATP synthase subunit delta [Sphingomonas sp. LaA6.9]|uniref:F0F1 ATP synthase subunit delta n=1 Tax=Sphingomonas sp. LaA6.9 TaxID=2919914 RepID=UPI001F4F5E92|nr:F0F1 ATP synthase subunit delta [Sphingomonas sp. LaA6.9]MCJ8156813.1 F0F1 ATP synthase subunit delta [Sphingomonas sp. LaA6.9]
METSGGIQASLAGRYATALFELARESNKIEAVEKSLATLKAALSDSDDFRQLTASPLVSRADATKGVVSAAKAMKVDPLTENFLGVLAGNRRLGELGSMIRAFTTLAANFRGEMTAEVTSAHPLNAAQVTELKKQLKTRVGRDVSVDLNVDPAILGGLVVRIGSQMIDSSIKTRLNSLAHAMKG